MIACLRDSDFCLGFDLELKPRLVEAQKASVIVLRKLSRDEIDAASKTYDAVPKILELAKELQDIDEASAAALRERKFTVDRNKGIDARAKNVLDFLEIAEGIDTVLLWSPIMQVLRIKEVAAALVRLTKCKHTREALKKQMRTTALKLLESKCSLFFLFADRKKCSRSVAPASASSRSSRSARAPNMRKAFRRL